MCSETPRGCHKQKAKYAVVVLVFFGGFFQRPDNLIINHVEAAALGSRIFFLKKGLKMGIIWVLSF